LLPLIPVLFSFFGGVWVRERRREREREREREK